MTETVLVVAKGTSRGRSKTRLQPPLTPAQGAALHEALLLDTLDACRSQAADVRVLYGAAEDRSDLARLVPDVALVQQEGRGLADALRLGIARHAVRGPVAIVSSDVPGLPRDAIRATFEALADRADVVLGPALDGGYWLVAMGEAHEAPFREIPWSTPAVLAVTRQRCEEAGLRVAELGFWRDIDTLVDLAFLRRDADGLVAPRTVELVRALGELVPEPPDLELAESALVAGSPWRAMLHDRLRWNGSESEYGYLAVPRAVFVAAMTGDGDLLLVRQYRHPVRDWTLEVPAGSVADGESPLEAAQRELREETGGRADTWTHLSTFFSSSAHISLRSDAFLSTGVELGDAEPEQGEDVALVRMPLAEAVARARAGGFAEGQTALTILLAAERLERDGGRADLRGWPNDGTD
jgi:rSAM/selenodomain-associated transferase 1